MRKGRNYSSEPALMSAVQCGRSLFQEPCIPGAAVFDHRRYYRSSGFGLPGSVPLPRLLKTVLFYPDFAIPHKQYTRQSVMGLFAENSVTSDNTYRRAVMDEKSVVRYPDGEKALAPSSTVNRWVTSPSRLVNTTQVALGLIYQRTHAPLFAATWINGSSLGQSTGLTDVKVVC